MMSGGKYNDHTQSQLTRNNSTTTIGVGGDRHGEENNKYKFN